MIEALVLGPIVAVSVVVAAHGSWWTLLSAVALKPAPAPNTSAGGQRFVVLVPAHNEEAVLAQTLRSILASTYKPSPRVVVIADNCTDRTALVAASEGAAVLERHDELNRGKGFALRFALDTLHAEPPDAVVIIDADTIVEPGFFDAVAAELGRGAQVVQGHYRAAPGHTDLGRIRRLAFHLVHYARPLGATRLGAGVGLKGNGMAFRWPIAGGGVSGSGIVEDAEHALELSARGIPVAFAPRAVVTGLMAQDYGSAATQDRRWESGRQGLRTRALRIAIRRFAARDFGSGAQALEVASLPLTALLAAGIVAACLDLATTRTYLPLLATGTLLTYGAFGVVSARPTLADLRAAAAVPKFLVYKLGILARVAVRRQEAWKRTPRPNES